jgi:hypothetical protein
MANHCKSSTAEAIALNSLVDVILVTSGTFSGSQMFAVSLTCGG